MLIKSLKKVVFTPCHKPGSYCLFIGAHTVSMKCIPKCVLVIKHPNFSGLYEISCALFLLNHTDLFIYVCVGGRLQKSEGSLLE